ncbi:MAG: hypothetical protein WC516_07950 [Patescibacteria group bacterium]|jgi:hypothetical protein
MTGVPIETLEYARITARLVEHDVYLKEKYRYGWILSDEKQKKPFYLIYSNGDVDEVIE